MKYRNLTILALLLLTPILFLALVTIEPAFAQSPTETNAVKSAKDKLLNIGTTTGFVKKNDKLIDNDAEFYSRFALIVNIVLGMVGVLATAYLVYSGVKWITAGGNEEQIKSAKEGIKNAVIGLAVIFLGFVIVNFVVSRVIDIAQGTA